jgi:hypothetical protein
MVAVSGRINSNQLTQMRTRIMIAAWSLLLVTSLPGADVGQRPHRDNDVKALNQMDRLQGVYHGVIEGSSKMSLVLRREGTFVLSWQRDAARLGSSRGRWAASSNRVDLRIYRATGDGLEPADWGQFQQTTNFVVVTFGDRSALIPEWTHDRYETEGLSSRIGLYWQQDAPIPVRSNPQEAPLIEIKDLVENRKIYKGKRVMIEGEFAVGFEYSVIIPRGGNEATGVWINPLPVEWASVDNFDFTWITNRSWGQISRARVRVVGVLEYNASQPELGVGHLNMCPVELDDLEYLKPVGSESLSK